MMKQFIAALALVSLLAGPTSALATTNDVTDPGATLIETGFTVGTSCEQDPTNSPIIKAVWEEEDDDLTVDETQIIPQGDCDTKEKVKICAVIEDNTFYKDEGNNEINQEVDVFSRAYYDRRPGECNDDLNSLVTNLNTGLDKLDMPVLSETQGIAEFCNGDPESNPTIVKYYQKSDSSYYDYQDICGNNDPVTSDGQLYKGTAKVFCGDFYLSFEAAAGDYEVFVKAMDSDSLYDETERNTNWFTYVPVMAYELDFDEIDYGNVSTDGWNRGRNGNNIGDASWGWSTDPTPILRPTVRNLGNVELKMSVMQGGMVNNTPASNLYGDALDNVMYQAKVGNAAWSSTYYPNDTVVLDDKLALSQYLEMDFAIKTTDGMQTGDRYAGDMTLDAVYQPFATAPTPIHTEWSCEHVGGTFDIANPG